MREDAQPVTPIENLAAWEIHHVAFDIARSMGADFKCATEVGFAATDAAEGKPRPAELCAVCRRRLERRDYQ